MTGEQVTLTEEEREAVVASLSTDCAEALHARCQHHGGPCECACHDQYRACLADEDRARVAERAESWWV